LAVIVNFQFSQGSVATQLRGGGNCYHSYSDSFLGNLPVKEFWKSVNIRRSYDQKTKWLLFWNTVYSFRKFRSGLKIGWINNISNDLVGIFTGRA